MAEEKIPRGQTPKMRAYQKAYRKANPRDRSEYFAKYRAENKEKAAAYRVANQERERLRAKEYYLANREKILSRVKAWNEVHKGRIQAYRKANPDKTRDIAAAYRKANPDKMRHYATKRRARRSGNGGSHTLDELIEKFNSLGNVCYYCGRAGKLTVDHNIPLSMGGTDNIDNILPACHSCNSKKNTRTANEYLLKLSLGER